MKNIFTLALAVGLYLFSFQVNAQGESPHFFKIGGNNPSANANFSDRFGFTTPHDLRFITNDVERMTLTKDGWLGIGNTNPQQRLHINGNMQVEKIIATRITSLDSVIAFGDSTIYLDHDHNRITWTTSNTAKGFSIGNLSMVTALNGLAFGHGVFSQAENAITIGSGHPQSSTAISGLNNTTPNSLVIGFNSIVPTFFVGPGENTVSGNIGIGTSSPTSKLDIEGDIEISGSRLHVNTNGNVGIGTSSPTSKFHLAGDIEISGSRLHVSSNGNIGVGTTYIPAGYKMAVNGKIIAEEVRVLLRADWPDYVFADGYKRMTWKEKESFLKINKHLPSIKSACDINADGLEIGETMTGLTKNVEENSLDIIELHKENERLKDELKHLNEKLDFLIKGN